MNVLAVDIGRTACRAAVFAEGRRGATLRLDSGATLSDPGGPTKLGVMVRTSAGELGWDDVGGDRAVVVGAAGALGRPAAARDLADRLSASGPRATEVVVTTDIVAAHAGALAGEPGVVLAAGTGSVAFAVDAGGQTTLVDGAGYLVGDDGSGFAVGRAGLAAAMRAYDGRPNGSRLLADAAADRFGPLASLPGVLHGNPAPARTVASFAPAVADAARAGDAAAAAIWRRAVADLADTAATACGALPERHRRVAVTGSLFEIEDLVTEPFRDLLAVRHPEVVVRSPDGDALAGAARLVGGFAGVYETLLIRRSA